MADDLASQRMLVTGASGFIGSHLVRRLAGAGTEVHAVSRSRADGDDGTRWWQADLADMAAARAVAEAVRPDVIFHLAGHVMGGTSLEQVGPTFRSNLQSTVNIGTLAAELGCRRLLLAGSAYEASVGNPGATPVSPYAVAKLAAGVYADMFHSLYGVPMVTLRINLTYGPAQRDLKKLIPYVILSLLRGEAPRLMSGKRQVDWVYVDDVVEAFVSAAATDAIDGLTLDVGSGQLVSIRETVERIQRIVGSKSEPEFGALSGGPAEDFQVRSNPEGTRRVIGWAPTIDLDEGLRRTVAWYREQLETGA